MQVRAVAVAAATATAGRATARPGKTAQQHSSQQAGARCCRSGILTWGVTPAAAMPALCAAPAAAGCSGAAACEGRALRHPNLQAGRQTDRRAGRWRGEAEGQQAGTCGGLSRQGSCCTSNRTLHIHRNEAAGMQDGGRQVGQPAHHLPHPHPRHLPRCHLYLHCTAAACRQWPGWRAAAGAAGRQNWKTSGASGNGRCSILRCRCKDAHTNKQTRNAHTCT